MLVEVPLTEDERAAAESDQQAVEKLIDGLQDVATPAGPSPRQTLTTVARSWGLRRAKGRHADERQHISTGRSRRSARACCVNRSNRRQASHLGLGSASGVTATTALTPPVNCTLVG